MPAHMTPTEAQERLNRDPSCIYLDVRSVAEFEAGHAPGAYNLPLLDRDPATGMMMPNPHFVAQAGALFPTSTPIIAGCRSGARSLQAAMLLEQAGFTDVTNLSGGFLGRTNEAGMKEEPGWVDAGLPVEREAQAGHDFAALRARIQGTAPET